MFGPLRKDMAGGVGLAAPVSKHSQKEASHLPTALITAPASIPLTRPCVAHTQ